MSYILDALKKSEQERGQGNIPGVQTVHSAGINYTSKRIIWPYILILAISLNLIAIVYFIIDKNRTPEVDAETNVNVESRQAVTEIQNTVPATAQPVYIQAPDPAYSTPAAQMPATQKTNSQYTEPTTFESAMYGPEPEEELDDNYEQEYNNPVIIEFDELPEATRQQLPAIIISAHVYSTNPLQRSIVINNNFLEEGEYVLDGLVLQEITRDGAIFSYENTWFHMGVVAGWQ
jgi:general secretion pathway protein B